MNKLSLFASSLMPALPLIACAKRTPEIDNDARTKLLRESTAVQAVLDGYEWERPNQGLNTRINPHLEESIVEADGVAVCRMDFKRTWGEAMHMTGRVDENLSDGTITRCWVKLEAQNLDGYHVVWEADENYWADDLIGFSVNREAVKGAVGRRFLEIFGCSEDSRPPNECGYTYRLKGDWVKVGKQAIRKNGIFEEVKKICKKAVEAAGLNSCK